MAKQFSADGFYVNDMHGRRVATAVTTMDASSIAMALNYFERLYVVLKLCRGEFELNTMPTSRPAYLDLVALAEEIEQDLK